MNEQWQKGWSFVLQLHLFMRQRLNLKLTVVDTTYCVLLGMPFE